MNRFQLVLSAIAMLAAGNFVMGCSPGGIGDPCIPEDEYKKDFAGYDKDEVNVEAMSFQCETRLCLVNHFQGRVSCPYGQRIPEGSTVESLPYEQRCKVPDGTSKKFVSVDVEAQLLGRRAENSVYCSCRCAGPDKNAKYCKCPSGYYCAVLNEIPLGSGESQLLGSYCVRNNTGYYENKPRSCAEAQKLDGTCDAECKLGKPGQACDYDGYPANSNPF